MTSISDQVRRYIAKIDPAVSGQDGHGKTFHVACVLVQEFGLSIDEARPLMHEYNRTCSPPWNEKEIEHKLREAEKKPAPPEGRGYRAKQKRGYIYGSHDSAPSATVYDVKPAAVVEVQPRDYSKEIGVVELPAPMADGTRELIRAAFQPGEGVRLCLAKSNDADGKENPKDAGLTLSREEWLKRLDKSNGDPNKILSTSQRNGIFAGINPLKIGGAKDDDVTAFRHALIEWDNVSKQEQYGLIVSSGVPCTAVIDSGGKSIHAWVRVDAKDRKEFNERVRIIYQHFEASGFKTDDKNKNPARLSRLAGCVRGQNRQELLAVGIGAESFTHWLKSVQADDLGPCYSLAELAAVDTKKDPDCVIGFRDGLTLRYLCRGKSAWLIGPSGIGKSTLNAEFAIGWALGLPVYGIAPARKLKSLIVQAENDFFDLAEMAQGVIRAHKLNPEWDADNSFAAVNDMVRFKTEDRRIGQEFLDWLHRLIDRERPDIVWIDPLLSFAGIDVNKQDAVSHFLRGGVNPILGATKAVMIGTHHTGKIKNSKKEMDNWTPLDFAYAGLGSSELVNWARAVMTLVPIEGPNYRLELAKRGPRAGARHPDGTEAYSTVYLRHSRSGGVRWEQVIPPQAYEPEEDGKPGRPNRVNELASINSHEVLAGIPKEGLSANKLGKMFENWSKQIGKTIGLTKARTDLLDKLIETGKLEYDATNEVYKRGKNA
jgi:RecA-family ATPase